MEWYRPYSYGIFFAPENCPETLAPLIARSRLAERPSPKFVQNPQTSERLAHIPRNDFRVMNGLGAAIAQLRDSLCFPTTRALQERLE